MICSRCGGNETVEVEQIFKDKSLHIALKCADCDCHIRYLQTVTDEDFRMPFGKHKGELLLDLPESYVEWLFEQDIAKGSLKDRFVRLYAKRVKGFKPLKCD